MPGWVTTAREYASATHFGPTVAVTTFTAVLALAAGAGTGTLLIAAAVLTGQLSIGWSNDYLDAGIDRAAGRLDKAVVRGSISERGLLRAAVFAVLLSVPLSLATGLAAAAAQLGAVACGWAYNLGLKRTAASPVPYAVAFALTPPAFVALALDRSPEPQVVLAGGLLGLCAHFTNAVKDLDADALTGVRGLPQRIGPRWSALVSAVLLLVAALVLLPGRSPSILSLWLAGAAALMAVGYALLIAGGRQHHGFTLNVVAIALLIAAVLTR